MIDKRAIKSEVEAAVKEGEERLRQFESEIGRMVPPPPSPGLAGPATLRAHFFSLLQCVGKPDLYSAILQHFLKLHAIPFPGGVFKRSFRFEFGEPDASLSLGGVTGLIGARRPGRPSKEAEAWGIVKLWGENGYPSFGRLANILNKGRHMTPAENKREADRLRQQVKSALKRREKKTA
jgi:hypothetical protein